MIAADEYLLTTHPNNKEGVRMKTSLYNAIKEFILDLLESDDGKISFNTFLDKVHNQFVFELGENTGWYLYNVKLDLEARGIIKHERIHRRAGPSTVRLLVRRDRKKGKHKNEPSTNSKRTIVNNAVKTKFIELYKTQPLIVHSPGRINLIGEHTDYNNGYVMPAAIDKGIQMALAKSDFDRSLVYSIKFDQFFSIDINNPEKVESPQWANYLLGVISQLNSRGVSFGNFNCVFDGDLPTGAGLSSSAAMECGFVFGLNELFKLKVPKLDMIHIAQWAEHNYVGVKCGIMDQFTSMMGKENQAMVLDCQWLSYDYFPLDLGEYCLLLCDTNVKHSLASSEYNTRRNECEEGVSILKKDFATLTSLRDVTREMLTENKDKLPSKVYNRCLYVVEENARVLEGSQDLQQGKLSAFGEKMFETHVGLSDLYEVSCPELDFLVEKARGFEGVLGARMMGGGFGGCTLNIIHEKSVEGYLKTTRSSYRHQFGIELSSYVVKTGDGTSILANS